jgi:hypothetical protein
LKKVKTFLEDYCLGENLYDLVYFDAFAPDVQPELWDKVFSGQFINPCVKKLCFVLIQPKGKSDVDCKKSVLR